MKATEILHERGQSLWLDNITRAMLDAGTIQHYIDAYSVTGLTSNPSIFDKAIGSGGYDDAIAAKAAAGLSGEDLFFDLAIEDLRRAADAFLGVHERTDGDARTTARFGSKLHHPRPRLEAIFRRNRHHVRNPVAERIDRKIRFPVAIHLEASIRAFDAAKMSADRESRT